MPNTHGADVRQSCTLQSLSRFTPDGINALAAVGIVLLDAINCGELSVTDSRHARGKLIDALYVLQDALHGSDDPLPAALASFLSVAESGVRHD